MTTLSEYYNSINFQNFQEGFSQQVEGQTEFLKNIVDNESINYVMEIGFNGGHSAELFLSSNKNIHLVSFDIGCYNYVMLGKQFIDKQYPGRHTLILGNSLHSVPEFAKTHNKKFDLIFIDGGHQYEVSRGDILNCKDLAHDKTIVIVDDTIHTPDWTHSYNIGPTRAWEEAKNMNIVKEVESTDYSPGRGQSWGYYVHN